MGLFQRLAGVLKLTETSRQKIFSLFGSFNANQFALNSESLINNSYEQNVDVYAVIRKIIDVSKSVDWVLEQKQADGTWLEITDTPVHELMNNPNPSKGYSWDDIEEQILLYLLATGNSYLIGEIGIGSKFIQEVDVLPATNVTITSNEDFFLTNRSYKFQAGKSKRTYDGSEIEHIRYFNPAFNSVTDSLYGLSPIQVAARAIQVSNDRWDADANLLQNRGAVGLISDKSNRPMTAAEAKAVQGKFNNDTAGPAKFGSVHVTNKDLVYIPMAMSSTDLQLLEKGVVNLRAICNVFGVDSSLFNDPSNKTFNNRLEAEKSLYTNVVMPLSGKIAQAHTNYIVKNVFPEGNVRLRQDFSTVEVLQKNLKDKADTAIKLRQSGILTANEARDVIDYEGIADENADKLIISTTLTDSLNGNATD